MKLRSGLYPQIHQFSVVPPQDGGFSLTPVESVIRGFRNAKDTLVLELAGVDQVVFYGMRTNNAAAVRGMMMSHFPQAILGESVRTLVSGSYIDDQNAMETPRGDWMFLDEDEVGLVQTVYLEYDSYLPLTVIEDREIRESEMDPLAGVVGLLAGSTSGEGQDGRGSDRFGLRIIARPADERWGQQSQNKFQDRRDGEDRSGHVPQGDAPSWGTLGLLALVGGVLAGNGLAWQNDMLPWAVAGDAALVLGGGAMGIARTRGGGRRKRRPYIDERLVDEKLKSLCYHCELQVVRIFRNPLDREMMVQQVMGMVDALRAFDNSAGNAWRLGKMYEFSGQDVFGGSLNHPFRGGMHEVSQLDAKKAERCVLSAKELALVWHLPLGRMELASMERASSVVLLPYTPELNMGGEGSGPLVGKSGRETLDVYLPDSAIAKHTLIVGKSGQGKSTTLKHVLGYKFRQKARGLDDGAIVLIDPHSDLVHEVLRLVPAEIADKVRLLDFGRIDRVPGMNLVDPNLFPDRDRCVDTIIETVKGLWEHWGTRLEDLLRRSLTMVYEFNEHEDTGDDMLTMLDILMILSGGERVGQGRDAHYVQSNFQRHVLSRVRDPRLHQWMDDFLKWEPGERAMSVAPVNSRVGYYAQNLRSSVVMGQRRSTFVMSEVLDEGLIVLVATAAGAVGKGAASLMGGTVVSLVDSALRSQESMESSKRKKCLVVCDEFQTVTGADWESMLAEDRKYGGSIMLSTQSLLRLDSEERKLREGVLGNIGCFVAYKISADDALIVSREMDAERVHQSNFVSLHPHHCYVKIDTDKKSFPAFSMRSLPPPPPVEDAEETVRRVMEASVEYTVDWQESRAKIEADVKKQMELSTGGGGKVSFAKEAREAKGRGPVGGDGSVEELVVLGGDAEVAPVREPVPEEVGEPVASGVGARGPSWLSEAAERVDVHGGRRSEGPGGGNSGVEDSGGEGEWSLTGLGTGGDLFSWDSGRARGPVLGDEDESEDRVVRRAVREPLAESGAVEAVGGLGVSDDGDERKEQEDGTGGDGDERKGQEDGTGGDGDGGVGGGSRGGSEGRKPAFNSYGRSPTAVVGGGSSLRGVDAHMVEGSMFGIEALEQIAQNGDDPGVQAVFGKIFRGKYRAELKKEYRRGRRDLLRELGMLNDAGEEVLVKAAPGVVVEGPGEVEGGSPRERRAAGFSELVDAHLPVEDEDEGEVKE